MFIFKQIKDLQNHLSNFDSIGFVPTMGALHEGHLSLINQSKKENTLSVCSIFVNPTQFNNSNDFDKYPITIESDIEFLESVNCDVLFLPSVNEMYPDGIIDIKQYQIGYLDTILDGKFRPNHFNGVCVIVHKLLQAVQPQKLYLGEKDFQQCAVIKQLVKSENIPVEIVTCPTLRMPNGLAMSSRNKRLSDFGLSMASLIYKCLNDIKNEQFDHSFEILQSKNIDILSAKNFKTEYLLLANADTLEILQDFDHSKNMVLLIASFFEEVRLIDNLRLN